MKLSAKQQEAIVFAATNQDRITRDDGHSVRALNALVAAGYLVVADKHTWQLTPAGREVAKTIY